MHDRALAVQPQPPLRGAPSVRARRGKVAPELEQLVVEQLTRGRPSEPNARLRLRLGHADICVVDMLHACRTFAAEPSSPGRVRRFMRRVLAAEVPADRLETAVLLASELASNAVMHARTDFDVRITVTSRTLRVALSDDSSRLPLPVEVDAEATSGRGLRLLDGLASRWGTDAHVTGKSVWFELPMRDATIIDFAIVRAALGTDGPVGGRATASRRIRS